VFWVISAYFNIRNTLPKSGTSLPGHPVYCHELGKRDYRRVWTGWLEFIDSELHVTVHWDTGFNPQPITVSISRFLATDLAQWRSSSFRGHAVAHWLTLPTPIHTAIFSASLAEPSSRLTAHLELGNSTNSSQLISSLKPLFTDLTGNTVSSNTHIIVCLQIRCLETGYPIVACVFVAAGMFLPSRCLAMNYSGFQESCHDIYIPGTSWRKWIQSVHWIAKNVRFWTLAAVTRWLNVIRPVLACGRSHVSTQQ
jgi:hypothetical protein